MMIKITDIYRKLNEEKSEKGDVKVADLIKDDSKSGAAKAAILKKKWQISSHDITEVAEFKKKKLAAELDKLKGVDESKINEAGEKDEYEEFFNMKLKKWSVKSPSELSDEDKKKFFDEIEKEWDKENEAAMAFLEEKKACKKKKKEEEVNTEEFDKDKKVNEADALNEGFTLAALTALVAYSSGKLIMALIDAKKSKNKVLKQIKSEKDPEKKAKLQEEYNKAGSYERQLKGDIIKAKEKIDKQKIKLTTKQSASAVEALGNYKEELAKLQQEEKDLREAMNESAEQIDVYTSNYFHFYEKMFSKVDTKEKIDEIVASVFPKLVAEKDLNEAREALLFFRNYRLAELGIE